MNGRVNADCNNGASDEDVAENDLKWLTGPLLPSTADGGYCASAGDYGQHARDSRLFNMNIISKNKMEFWSDW